MANNQPRINQRVVIGIAVVAVGIAVVAIVVLLISVNSPSNETVASLGSPTATQNEDTERTKIFDELTSTGIALAATNQAATVAALANATVASTPLPTQNEDTVRTQIYAEMTTTGIVLAVTNQAATLVSLQGTIDARAQITPSSLPPQVTVVTQIVQQSVLPPTVQPQTLATAIPATAIPAVAVQQPVAVTDPMQVQLGVCAQQATREGRLDCATQYYLQLGQGLAGIKGYMRSLGATWSKLDVTLPFQPDADQLGSGGMRIWGARVQADTLTVSGNSCLVTDVPSRLGHYGWQFLDTRLNPAVYHVGNGSTAQGQVVDIAFNGDCTDWPEIVAAMNK